MSKRIADNVISVTTPLDVTFFKAWLDFTAPMHNLTNKEKLVMAYFLKERYELSKIITDEAILSQVLNSIQTKKKIMKECEIDSSNLQVVLHKIKKSGLMENGKIKPQLIPAIEGVEDTGEYRLMIRFLLKK